MKLFIICHNIRSRENVGSIFRTSDAFGIGKIFLAGYTPAPPHPKISKTALGAENLIPWEKVFSTTRLIKKLKSEGFLIIALENNRSRHIDISKFRYNPKKPLVLILGNEVSGIPPRILKQCDKVLEIPMKGKKESLNVAVAFGVAAYALPKNRP
ncbi:MAG: hypothetical protein A3G49_03060 [Candidatus Sungbacteria bacterium RIFCSPLOWO2_12_FULL_41_11]|uniref:tRNA/rRNA methyltransferase SpoU type domain-containing protein n=1 Tax=Candidatus Sungbacteria bacterium RIFCSPLOWO2_12_FULL_41_11 TaxID=1802286 RepID=A0A1G2LRC8_9BACT|nr:MAG: tRNA/rRNA methyltransferase [Parcubacteria group bacterium GW2011_GWA2_42_14]OGZ98495.1 MAG: hypothetical protein A3D41_05970 [Candidatus Sungbacteria bacterium RIFCSPHIGHO2_02_FULL_41_12b]OHA14195.1 MAG: hypothetical protein A3G49_03060 [Candidatus Sungbacteria bacterium RIFCSPLOWO2_12_FULL_41_11]